MAVVRIGGPGGPNLPTFPGLANQSAAVGVPGQSGYYAGLSNAITLGPGEVFNIPSGTYMVYPGPYTFLQWLDPVSNTFKARPTAATTTPWINSDGSNYRLANTTGCPIGAVVTTGTATGTVNGIGAAINLLSCAASSGSSTWQTIVGGAISTTIATATTTANTTVGSGYLYPPIIVIDAPPTGGLQATAHVTSLSSGTVIAANIQVDNQGAGYSTAPTMTFINDPRDTAGSGAIYVTTLTATGNLTACYPINHGAPLTGVPALTFALTNSANTVSCAATAIMNWTVTAYASGVTVGSSIGAAELVTINNVITASTTPVTNPLHTTSLTFPRPARINVTVTGGVTQTTGSIIEDAGLGIQLVPTGIVAYSITSTTAVAPQVSTISVGGTTDVSYIQPV